MIVRTTVRMTWAQAMAVAGELGFADATYRDLPALFEGLLDCKSFQLGGDGLPATDRIVVAFADDVDAIEFKLRFAEALEAEDAEPQTSVWARGALSRTTPITNGNAQASWQRVKSMVAPSVSTLSPGGLPIFPPPPTPTP